MKESQPLAARFTGWVAEPRTTEDAFLLEQRQRLAAQESASAAAIPVYLTPSMELEMILAEERIRRDQSIAAPAAAQITGWVAEPASDVDAFLIKQDLLRREPNAIPAVRPFRR